MSESREILTLPDAVAARYGGKGPRLMMGLAVFLGVLGYLGTQVMAVGYVLTAVLNVDILTALLIGLGVLGFYSVAGGIIAGVYTDLFQGVIMMGAAVCVCYFAIASAGGMSEMSRTLWEWDPIFIGAWGTRGSTTALSWYLLFCVGAVGQPHVITKFLMLKDVRTMRWGPALTGITYALTSLLWLSIGFAMRALVLKGEQAPLEQPDLAAPMFLLNHAPEWVAGLVFAGLLAAIMSTADSFLNIGAAAVVRDIPTALFGRPMHRELFWTRVATVGLLVGSCLFALYMENLVALLGTFGWGTFAAAIVPSVGIGLNWKRATALACTLSVATSLALNFALELSALYGIYTLPNGFAVGAFSLLASTAVFIAVSLATPMEKLPADVEAAMEV
jgi:sodium/proline symporter